MGKLTKILFAGWVAALCASLLVLPTGAQAQSGVNPMAAFAMQFVLVMGLIFVALLLTRRIAAWIDRLRKKRKD